jgi:hypothetical protein
MCDSQDQIFKERCHSASLAEPWPRWRPLPRRLRKVTMVVNLVNLRKIADVMDVYGDNSG